MKKKLKDFYYQKIANPIEKRLDKILVTRHRIPLSKILAIFFHKMLKEYPEEKASAMAFNFILSIFPGIIFFFTLLPYIPIPNLRNNILD
ncbi:MAG: YihY/virulence factor BrkB family protein, partial [Cytophagaceae bacterium]